MTKLRMGAVGMGMGAESPSCNPLYFAADASRLAALRTLAIFLDMARSRPAIFRGLQIDQLIPDDELQFDRIPTTKQRRGVEFNATRRLGIFSYKPAMAFTRSLRSASWMSSKLSR